MALRKSRPPIFVLSSSLFLPTDVTAGEPTKTIDNGPETIILSKIDNFKQLG